MPLALRRSFCAGILAICFAGAAANVAQAATALDHACCHRAPAGSSAAPEVPPCDGFMPLTCCRAAALPGGDHGAAPAPSVIALVDSGALLAPARVTVALPALPVHAPRIAATRLSVVLLI